MKLNFFFLSATISILLFSCVSQRKYKECLSKFDSLQMVNLKTQQELKNCLDDKDSCNKQVNNWQNKNSNLAVEKNMKDVQIADLNKQIEYLKSTNETANKQLQNISNMSSTQAQTLKQQVESLQQSLMNLQSKDAYIQSLQQSIAKRDSAALNLILNLKGVLGNIEDTDINVKVDKDVVYIDISDKLLFKSGSYDITPRASEVLGKVAKVLNNQPDIEFIVEGHTDNVPFKNGLLLDNWDLSCKRATAIVRVLQTQYNVDPARITAAGRSEYIPLTTNDTAEGRAANRRTRIIITPQYGQFYKLLKAPNQQ